MNIDANELNAYLEKKKKKSDSIKFLRYELVVWSCERI